MATRRIDASEQLGPVLDKLKETGRKAHTDSIYRPKGTPGAQGIPETEEFEALLGKAAEDSGLKKDTTLQACITDLIIPHIQNPKILNIGYRVQLLEELRDEILPTITTNDELRELAERVIDEEISRHRYVLSQRAESGLAA